MGKSLAAEAPPPTGGPEAWRHHPRLRRHAFKIQTASKPIAVLARYREAYATCSDPLLRQRHTVHVAAWVALLPDDHESLPACASLLGSLLRTHTCSNSTGKKVWLRTARSGWLDGALHLVALRLQEVHQHASGQVAGCWSELRSSMPHGIWKKLRATCPPPPPQKADQVKQGLGEKREEEMRDEVETHRVKVDTQLAPKPAMLREARRLQHLGIVHMDALQGSERGAAIKDTLHRACAAMDSGDADAMVDAAVSVVGLMSPPRAVAKGEEDAKPMPESAKARLEAAEQVRLRAALLQLLGLRGEGGLDLNDAGTKKLLKIPFERLRHLMQQRAICHCTSRPQWGLLAGAIGLAESGGQDLQGISPDAPDEALALNGTPSLRRAAVQIEWTRDMDRKLLEFRAQGMTFTAMQESFGRSLAYLSGRFKQLLEDPDAPCPSSSSANNSQRLAHHRKLAQNALLGLPGQRGTPSQICNAILGMPEAVISGLNRELETRPTRCSNGKEKWMNYVADELSKRHEFYKVGKVGNQAIWQLDMTKQNLQV